MDGITNNNQAADLNAASEPAVQQEVQISAAVAPDAVRTGTEKREAETKAQDVERLRIDIVKSS